HKSICASFRKMHKSVMPVSQKLCPSLPLQHRIRRMWWAYALLALVSGRETGTAIAKGYDNDG
ncbi:hypothetical protein ACC702_39765, partial [Rhizobium ruizarguesonis]